MPIQLIPTSTSQVGPGDGIQGFTNILQQMAQRKQQEERAAADMMLQRQRFEAQQQEHQRALQQAAIEDVMQHRDNPEMARLAAQKYGMTLGTGSPDMSSPGPQQAQSPQAPVQQPAQPMQPIQLQDLMDIDPGPSQGTPTVKVREPIAINAGGTNTGSVENPEQDHLNYAHQLLTHDDAVTKGGDRVEQFKQAEQAVQNGAIPGAPSPVYTLSSPMGSNVTIDTGSIRAAEEGNKAERIKKFQSILAGDPDALKTATMMVHLGQPDEVISKALIDSGKMNARLENRMQIMEEQFNRRQELAREFQTTATDKNRNAANMADARGATQERGEQQLTLSKENQARQIARDVFQQLGFKEAVIKDRRFNDLSKQFAVGSAALDASAAGAWVKQAQGGSGILSDRDMKVFYGQIGGIPTRIEDYVSKALSGKMGDKKREEMLSATKWLAGRAQENLGQIRDSLKYGLENSAVPEFTNSIMGTYFPEERGKRPAPAGQREPTAQPPGNPQKGPASGGGITPMDQQMYQKAQAAVSSPNTDPETRASAQRVLDHINKKMQQLQ